MDELPRLDLGDIQVIGSVTNIHFNNLTHKDPDHSLVAYARLIELMEDIGLDINDAIDQLLDERYLIEFFGRREVRDMFAEIFSYDQELIEKGAGNNAIEITKNGLKNNVPVETISIMTGLPIQEIENLKEDASNQK